MCKMYYYIILIVISQISLNDGAHIVKNSELTQNHFFRCDNVTHISSERVCNGIIDCLDHSDEIFCPDYNNSTCNAVCKDNSEKCCRYCDGINECEDGSDEEHCPSPTRCKYPNIYRCENSDKIICTSDLCDRYFDCEQKDDDLKNCDTCPHGYTKCSNTTSSPCVKKCDGSADCPSQTSVSIDEADCPNCKNNTLDVYICRDGTLICGEQYCDGHFDCEDKMDEIYCDTCPIGYKKCVMLYFTTRCVKLCDDIFECEDGSDEMFCPTTPCTLEDYYICDDGKIICGEQKCDGIFDCSNYEDELLCDICPPSYEKCDPSNKNEPCIKRCDGFEDCPNGSDESNCLMGQGCKGQGKFVCRNEAEICPEYICDGIKDCPDGEDEQGCHKNCK